MSGFEVLLPKASVRWLSTPFHKFANVFCRNRSLNDSERRFCCTVRRKAPSRQLAPHTRHALDLPPQVSLRRKKPVAGGAIAGRFTRESGGVCLLSHVCSPLRAVEMRNGHFSRCLIVSPSATVPSWVTGRRAQSGQSSATPQEWASARQTGIVTTDVDGAYECQRFRNQDGVLTVAGAGRSTR
jgi:hypothetical protein